MSHTLLLTPVHVRLNILSKEIWYLVSCMVTKDRCEIHIHNNFSIVLIKEKSIKTPRSPCVLLKDDTVL